MTISEVEGAKNSKEKPWNLRASMDERETAEE